VGGAIVQHNPSAPTSPSADSPAVRSAAIRADRHERQNGRRARQLEAEGAFTEVEVRALYAAQGGKCIYCKVVLGDRFTRDHIKPLSKGGSNYISNIQLLCNSCNCKKNDLDHHVFAAKMGMLV
jgi:5-methylcytosine-specific restriction endonuclease McrA